MDEFLKSVPIFRELGSDELAEIAAACRRERFPAGVSILQQGGYSNALYFLQSGRLAVNVHRGDQKDTVAHLSPPSVFGELSFITGRVCSADVDVLVDAEVIVFPRDAVPTLKSREQIMRGMMTVLAERLHDVNTRGNRVKPSPVVLLNNHPAWEAPLAFADELGRSLARQSGHDALVVNIGPAPASEERQVSEGAWHADVNAAAADETMRAAVARRLSEWKQRFNNIILNPTGPDAERIEEQIAPFADTIGELCGPGDPATLDAVAGRFTVQSAIAPTLSSLDGRRQLIWEAAESEAAFRSGGTPTPRFKRTVDSIVRSILGTQFGVALGGGAAWGWAHIGVLEVLQEAGLPLDVISGCSMGSVIGSLRAAGKTTGEMREIADYWKTRTGRFVEWRFWKMCLLNENVVRRVFHGYFGDRTLEQLEMPYWANAVDIKTGREFTILDGTVVDAVRASIALPGLLSPIARGEHLLLDAGIIDPVPVNLTRRMGAHFVLATNAMAALESQEINPRYPFNAFDIMMRCTRVMGHEIGQARAEEGADVVLTPLLGDITMLQFARAGAIIDCGRRAAEQHLPAITAGYDRLRKEQLAHQAATAPVGERL